MEYKDINNSLYDFTQKLKEIVESYSLPSIMKLNDEWFIYVLNDNNEAEWILF
jgi:hypothetical protein